MRKVVRRTTTRRGQFKIQSLMAEKGVNTRDLAQLLNTKYAVVQENVYEIAPAQIAKRKGLKAVLDIAGVTGFSVFEHYYNNVFIVGYGTTISAVDVVAGTETIIKSNFSENSPVSGQRYGNYFLLGSGGTEKVSRVSLTLSYTLTTAFTVGATITGGTSGATATILENTGSVLTIGNITGVFVNGEPITDDATGSGTLTTALTYLWTQIAAAPVAKFVSVSITGTSADARLLVGNMRNDKSLFQSSDIDTGANPPFNTWTIGTVPGNGFQVFNKRDGELKTIGSLGTQVIIGYETGRAGLRISVLGTTPRQEIQFDFQNHQDGMFESSTETSIGLCFANQSGLKALISGGQTNVPFSEQILGISFGLDPEYFFDVDFTTLRIIEDVKLGLIYFTMRKDSLNNNIIWTYNVNTKGLSSYLMNIDGFAKIADVIYGVSSVSGKVYEMFTVEDDDGLPIPTDFTQEIALNSFNNTFDLNYFLIQAIIAEGSVHDIHFSTFDLDGVFNEDVAVHQITGVTPSLLLSGLGSGGFGTSGWGTSGFGSSGKIGTTTSALSTLERPYQNKDIALKEFSRLIVRFTSNDGLPARYNFFTADIVNRQQSILTNNLPVI